MSSTGTVYLVGAGPGDPGLLTLRAAELLGRADVVVYDALVNKDLLRLAPKSAEIIYGGKRSKDHAIPCGRIERPPRCQSPRRQDRRPAPRWRSLFAPAGVEEAPNSPPPKSRLNCRPRHFFRHRIALNYAGIPHLRIRDHCFHASPSSPDTKIPARTSPVKELGAGRQNGSGQIAVLMGVSGISRNHRTNSSPTGPSPATPVDSPVTPTGPEQSIEGTLATIADVVEKSKFTGKPAVTVHRRRRQTPHKTQLVSSTALFGQTHRRHPHARAGQPAFAPTCRVERRSPGNSHHQDRPH